MSSLEMSLSYLEYVMRAFAQQLLSEEKPHQLGIDSYQVIFDLTKKKMTARAATFSEQL